jgi:uncharacterized protein (TIGR02145 family)
VFVCSEQNKLQIARRNHLSMRPIVFLSPLLSLLWLAAPSQAQYVSTWDPDADGDNVIGINDILLLLGVFEEGDSDADGILDFQDDCEGVYDMCGLCDGAGVDQDYDGICDEDDPCIGDLDVCQVCNGMGATFPVIDEILFFTDSVFIPPSGTWYVFSHAVDTLYTFVCPVQGCTDISAGNFNPTAVIEDGSCLYGPAQCNGESSLTYDGYTYELVGIGAQCWFKENLRSDSYRNGDWIPGNLNNSVWQAASYGAQSVFNNSLVYISYGRLYNWFAVNDNRGLCPAGWRVPSDEDWMSLEMALGMTSSQANSWGYRGTLQGVELKSSPSDVLPWNGSNTTGFGGLPGGYRSTNGLFYNHGYYGYWWSTSTNGNLAIDRSLGTVYSNVDRDDVNRKNGFSVRCIRN